MLTLRPVREDEFMPYLEHEIEAAARETAESYEVDLQQARQDARQQIMGLLPHGLQTAGHFLYLVEQEANGNRVPIGRTWFSIDESEQFAWLESIEIDEAFRRQGFGKQLLVLIEAELSRRGIQSMTLHVAETNERAFRFYQKCGYHVAAYNLAKTWHPHDIVDNPAYHLRPVTDEEADSVMRHEIETLALAFAAVYALDGQEASGAARAQVRGRLPDGLQTAGHFLYIIEQTEDQGNVPIGHIWFSIVDRAQVAWLQSFALHSAVQDLETAGQALAAVEAELAGRGIYSMKRYLVGNDERVLETHLKHGFKIGGRHMTKRWQDQQVQARPTGTG